MAGTQQFCANFVCYLSIYSGSSCTTIALESDRSIIAQVYWIFFSFFRYVFIYTIEKKSMKTQNPWMFPKVPELKIDLNHRMSRIKVLACHEPVCFSWYHMSWHEPDNMKSIISMIFTWLLLLPLLYHRPASSGIVIRQNWTHHSRNKTNIQSTVVKTSHLYESMSLLLGNEIQM